jgi:hypothetical protein
MALYGLLQGLQNKMNIQNVLAGSLPAYAHTSILFLSLSRNQQAELCLLTASCWGLAWLIVRH